MWVESAGSGPADFADADVRRRGREARAGRGDDLVVRRDLVLKVQPPTAAARSTLLREGALLVAILQPFQNADTVRRLAARRATAFSLDLLPRITRAQSMDVLSSMSTIAGYKGVLLAAAALPKMVPLLDDRGGDVEGRALPDPGRRRRGPAGDRDGASGSARWSRPSTSARR